MGTRRNIFRLRNGDVIDVMEFHDGRYGARGMKRIKKKKPSPEQIRKINAYNKMQRARRRLLQYFDETDCFATWTYEVRNRPPDMEAALGDFQKAIRIVRKEYKKRGRELFWIRNIERGTKGAWHIHLVVNEIGDTASILKAAWPKGGTFVEEIRMDDKIYDEDFTKLANYITKDQYTTYQKEDGAEGKPRIREANYNTSRNMPLPDPEIQKLVRWPRVKPKKGYYIARIHEGINPKTGYIYRRYTMIKIKEPEKTGRRKGRRIHDG